MAKIRKCKLNWKRSDSDRVVGYKLYWSVGNEVTYNSDSIALGNVSESALPEALERQPLFDQPVMFGVTAVDANGNESDMTTLAEPFRFDVPPAPMELSITVMDEFDVVAGSGRTSSRRTAESLAIDTASHPTPKERRIKYYDDVGYRKLTID